MPYKSNYFTVKVYNSGLDPPGCDFDEGKVPINMPSR